MTSPVRLSAVLEVMRMAFANADDLDPADADRFYSAILSHVRGRRGESVGCLGILPAPGAPVRDPRGSR